MPDTLTNIYTLPPEQQRQQEANANVQIPQNLQIQKEANKTFEQDPYMQSYTNQQLGAVDKMGELKGFADDLTNQSQQANQKLSQQITQRNSDIRQQASLSPTNIQGMLDNGPIDIQESQFDSNPLLSPFVASNIAKGQSKATSDTFDLATQMRGARGEFLGTELQNVLSAYDKFQERNFAMTEAEKKRDFDRIENDMDRVLTLNLQAKEDELESKGKQGKFHKYLSLDQEGQLDKLKTVEDLKGLNIAGNLLIDLEGFGGTEGLIKSLGVGATGPMANTWIGEFASADKRELRTSLDKFAADIRSKKFGAALSKIELEVAGLILPGKGYQEYDNANKLNAILKTALFTIDNSLNDAGMNEAQKLKYYEQGAKDLIRAGFIRSENGKIVYGRSSGSNETSGINGTAVNEAESLVEDQLM